MNDSEKRRQQLLMETRELYSDRGHIPAVHPRYGAAYRRLYGEEEEYVSSGTFGIRFLLCVLLFTAFMTLDRQDQKVMNMSTDQIVNEIVKDLDVAEVWKNL